MLGRSGESSILLNSVKVDAADGGREMLGEIGASGSFSGISEKSEDELSTEDVGTSMMSSSISLGRCKMD